MEMGNSSKWLAKWMHLNEWMEWNEPDSIGMEWNEWPSSRCQCQCQFQANANPSRLAEAEVAANLNSWLFQSKAIESLELIAGTINECVLV